MNAHEQGNHQQADQAQPAESKSRFQALRQEMMETTEVSQMMRAIGKEISLDSGRRPLNLRLLRALRGETQKAFIATQGFPSMSDGHYGNIESDRKKARLTDKEARKIEAINSLPMGWLDRENSGAMLLSHEEFKFVELIRKAPQEAQVAIATLCKHIANHKLAATQISAIQ